MLTDKTMMRELAETSTIPTVLSGRSLERHACELELASLRNEFRLWLSRARNKLLSADEAADMAESALQANIRVHESHLAQGAQAKRVLLRNRLRFLYLIQLQQFIEGNRFAAAVVHSWAKC